MDFKDKYTTSELVANDLSPKKEESKKIVISNDTYALSEMLDNLIKELSFRRGRL